MSDQLVDISFTIKESELQGRKYMLDMLTGQRFFVEGAEAAPEPIIDYDPTKDMKVKPKKTRAKKSAEGDK